MKYQDIIKKISSDYEINPNLISSIIRWESDFDPNAVSKTGAKGLMQLIDSTFTYVQKKYGKEWKKKDVFLPEINIEAGILYLQEPLEEFSPKVEKAYTVHYSLAGYKSGPKNIHNALYIINERNYPKNWESLTSHLRYITIHYVENVLRDMG